MEAYFVAHICLFAGDFAPRGWAFCQGQLLSISQNTALFSLLGTTYGGNGQTTFALPDFRGRIPVGQGMGPGLSNISLGEVAGSASMTLTANQMPVHNHTPVIVAGVSSESANTGNPEGSTLAISTENLYAPAANATETMTGSSITVDSAGGNQAFQKQMPYLGMNFVIALQGLFPSRN
jgi:microcystin-dependent protein